MPYLIDSDVLIDSLQGDRQTREFLEKLALEGIAISIVSYMETYQGTLRAEDPNSAQLRHSSLLEGVPVLPMNQAVARTCAEIRQELSENGRRVRSRALDLVVAATALHYGYTLVTRNHADYVDIPQLVLLAPPGDPD